MEVEVSSIFREFAEIHLIGPGFEAYLLQRKEILGFKNLRVISEGS
jgi:hypothetical protein